MKQATVALVSYKRPLFLAECIKSLYRKPGMSFELFQLEQGLEELFQWHRKSR